MKSPEIVVKNIKFELTKYIIDHKIKSLVLGVSGGMDSALCAALAKSVCDDTGIKLIGISIPISGNKDDEKSRASEIGENFCHDFEEVYLMDEDFQSIWSHLEPEGWEVEDEDSTRKFRQGNIKARLRMICLYDLAQLHHGMVLSTDNLTEYLLGFWTLHGDVGDYGMIQQLWKSEVYDLGEWLIENETTWTESQKKALQSCIDCQATDGLGITNSDLDQILPGWEGSSREGYKKVDEILQNYQMEYAISDGLMEYVDMTNPVVIRHRSSDFKRKNPYNISREDLFKGVS